MSGGGTDDPNVFNEDIFSPIRITVAPLLVLAGFFWRFMPLLKNQKTNINLMTLIEAIILGHN